MSPLPALPGGYSSALTAKIADDGDRFVLLFLPTGQAVVRLYRLDAATGTWTALWTSVLVGSVPYGLADVNALGDAVGSRFSGGEVSWSPGDPMVPLVSHLAGGYAGVPTDLYPGVALTAGTGISDSRVISVAAGFGNNGGFLTRMVPVAACTTATCLRVTALSIAARNPSRCSAGARLTATTTVTVRNRAGAAVPAASVKVTLLTQWFQRTVTATTGTTGTATIKVSMPACSGTVSALVEDVTKGALGFDRSGGVLVRSIIPTL